VTALLLDYPWPLDAVIDPTSKAFRVLRDFDNLVRQTGLPPVPFADSAELTEAITRLHAKPGSFKAEFFRFVRHCIREAPLPSGASTATPNNTGMPPLNPPLSTSWRRALRAALGNCHDWRNPQIVLPECRRRGWRQPEVEISLDDQPGTSHSRLTVPLDLGNYCQHRFATADVDPWRNLEWSAPPVNTGGNLFFCRLPRPPALHDAKLSDIENELPGARAAGWKINGRYYFIPPAEWKPVDRTRGQWRGGRAFATGNVNTPNGVLVGPVDSEGRVWYWDRNEGHWDVQHGTTYIRVSHEGRELV
jgi:hypothetical protein